MLIGGIQRMVDFERIAITKLENEVRKKIYGVIRCKLDGDNAITFIVDSDGYTWKYTTKNFIKSVAGGLPIPVVADRIVKNFTIEIMSKLLIHPKKG